MFESDFSAIARTNNARAGPSTKPYLSPAGETAQHGLAQGAAAGGPRMVRKGGGHVRACARASVGESTRTAIASNKNQVTGTPISSAFCSRTSYAVGFSGAPRSRVQCTHRFTPRIDTNLFPAVGGSCRCTEQ